LLALVLMVYKIRHCNDDTLIKIECSQIVMWWVIISFAEGIYYLLLKLQLCYNFKSHNLNYVIIQKV
jgi:hypothetical protein